MNKQQLTNTLVYAERKMIYDFESKLSCLNRILKEEKSVINQQKLLERKMDYEQMVINFKEIYGKEFPGLQRQFNELKPKINNYIEQFNQEKLEGVRK